MTRFFMAHLLAGSLAFPLSATLRAENLPATQTAAPTRDASRTDILQQDGISATFSP